MHVNHILAIILAVTAMLCKAQDPIPMVTKGSIERVEHFKSAYVEDRYLNIWLPPGYNTTQNYDVLYMHDGRMLFDATTTWNKQEWQVDEVAGSLIEQQKVRPFIVVGIPNAGQNRHSEFFPQQPFENLPIKAQQRMYKLERGPGHKLFASKIYSDKYASFLVEEVIPYVESNYAVNKGGQHRYLAGSSMGGLISWYTLMRYPEAFAGAICMSTHWPGTFSADDAAFATFKTFIDNNLAKLSTQKVYFDYGDATLDAMYPALQKQIDGLFRQHHYPPKQWRSEYFPGADHSEVSWAKRLAIPLEFMFSPLSSTSAP
jgi:enterochelin esterase-like enzyme